MCLKVFFLCLPHLSQVNTLINTLTVSQRTRTSFSCFVWWTELGRKPREALAAPALGPSGVPQQQRTASSRACPLGRLQPATDWGGCTKAGSIAPELPMGWARLQSIWTFPLPNPAFPSPPPQVSTCNKYSAPKTPSQWEPNLRQYLFIYFWPPFI